MSKLVPRRTDRRLRCRAGNFQCGGRCVSGSYVNSKGVKTKTQCKKMVGGVAKTGLKWQKEQAEKLSRQKPHGRSLASRQIDCAINFSECKVYPPGMSGYPERVKDMAIGLANEQFPLVEKEAIARLRNAYEFDITDKGKLVNGLESALFSLAMDKSSVPFGKIKPALDRMDKDIFDVYRSGDNVNWDTASKLRGESGAFSNEPMDYLFYQRVQSLASQYAKDNLDKLLPQIALAQTKFKEGFKDNSKAIAGINKILRGVEKKIRNEGKAERLEVANRLKKLDGVIDRVQTRIDGVGRGEDMEGRKEAMETRLSKLESVREDLRWDLGNDESIDKARALRELRTIELGLDWDNGDRLSSPPLTSPGWQKDMEKYLSGHMDKSAIAKIIATIDGDRKQYIFD